MCLARNFAFALIVFAAGCLVAPAQGNALVQTFFGEDLTPGGTVPPGGNAATARQNFLNALTAGVSTEDFESFVPGASSPLALSFVGGLGTILGTLNGDGATQNFLNSGRFPTSGEQYWNSFGTFSISFASPVAAFGFFATDIGDFDGNVTLQTSDGVTKDYLIPHTVLGPNGSLLFYGVIDTDNPFTDVTFGNTSEGVDGFGFDDLTVGDVSQVSAVPLPAAFPLFLSALGLLWGLSWRRRGFAFRRQRDHTSA